MSTNFPSSLDTTTQLPDISATDTMDATGKEHDVMHTNLADAVLALEKKVGANNSTDPTSVDWKVTGGVNNLTTPLSTNFTASRGTGTYSVTDKVGRMAVSVSSAATAPLFFLETAPTPPYTIDVRATLQGRNPASNDAISFTIAASDGTKFASFGLGVFGGTPTPKFSVDYWNSDTSYGSGPFSEYVFSFMKPFYLRLVDDGTNFNFYYSLNGLDFIELFTVGRTAWLSAVTKIGMMFYNNSSSSTNSKIAVEHYLVTNSALSDAS